jgi:amidase
VAHGDFKYVGYTGVYNVVDYSAVSFPTGFRVDKSKDGSYADSKAQSEYCQAARDSCESMAAFHILLGSVLIVADDAELLDGLPVSLQ